MTQGRQYGNGSNSLSLPDDVYHQAARIAQVMNQDVSHVLAEAIESMLSPLGSSAVVFAPVGELTDREVLAAAEVRMDEAQGKRLGKLLDRQQAGKLSEAERSELAALMQIYHGNLIQKAQALGEAVRRGLKRAA